MRDVDLSKPVEVPVKITPVYLNEQDESNERKAKFNMKFALACDDSVRYGVLGWLEITPSGRWQKVTLTHRCS